MTNIEQLLEKKEVTPEVLEKTAALDKKRVEWWKENASKLDDLDATASADQQKIEIWQRLAQ